MDWSNIFENMYLWYNEFAEWYLIQSVYVQILSIIGIITLLSLTIILVYYLIKGIAYLIYYILKGVYYLLKGIGYGIFKLCEGFYNLISGSSNSKKQTENNIIPVEDANRRDIMYCTECGNVFSEKMILKLINDGVVFCVNCGKNFQLADTLRAQIMSK